MRTGKTRILESCQWIEVFPKTAHDITVTLRVLNRIRATRPEPTIYNNARDLSKYAKESFAPTGRLAAGKAWIGPDAASGLQAAGKGQAHRLYPPGAVSRQILWLTDFFSQASALPIFPLAFVKMRCQCQSNPHSACLAETKRSSRKTNPA